MDKPYIELSYFQVLLAALLIVINGAISIVLKLELERRLLIAAVCTIVQLLLIGFVLEWVFRMDRWYIVVVMMSIMTLVAGVAASQRTAFSLSRHLGPERRRNVAQLVADGLIGTGRDCARAAVVHAAVRHPAAGDDPGQHAQRGVARPRSTGK